MAQKIEINNSGELVIYTDNGKIINDKIESSINGTFECDAQTVGQLKELFRNKITRLIPASNFRGYLLQYYVKVDDLNEWKETMKKAQDMRYLVDDYKKKLKYIGGQLECIKKLIRDFGVFSNRKDLLSYIEKCNNLVCETYCMDGYE